MIGAAGKHLVPGQHVGLAAEATDALDAANEVRARLRLDATQLAGGGTALEEARQLLIDRALDPGEIAARLGGRANHELPADLAEIDVRNHVRGDLFVIHEPLIESRGLPRGEHVGHQVEIIGVR